MKKLLFYHDNEPTHASFITAAKLIKLGAKFGPMWLFLFPNMQNPLSG